MLGLKELVQACEVDGVTVEVGFCVLGLLGRVVGGFYCGLVQPDQ
jgi:hypothetical protein